MDSNTFTLLYIFTFIIMGILILAPILITVLIIRAVKKKNKEEEEYYCKMAKERETIKEKQIQEEINIKKLKYKRVKCNYCGTNNKLDATNCINCGAVLPEIIPFNSP